MPLNKHEHKRIWITTDWEANPFMEGSPQLGRMNSLAKYLSENGYEVVLWFTTFSHPDKKYVAHKTEIRNISENETVVLLHSPVSYKQNMSPSRIVYHSRLAKEMKRLIKDTSRFPKPDLIFCSYPTEQFCRVAINYGKRNNVPVIMDARDQWPDIFERALPEKLRWAANIALAPFKKMTAADFSKASAICAMSPVMLKWALNYAKREQRELDTSIFIGCTKNILPDDVLKDELARWAKLGISASTWNICLFSTLSKTAVDVDTVIEAVKIVHEAHPEIRLIVGGKGDEEERLKAVAADLPFVKMMGWMNSREMTSLMSVSKAGLLCYRNTKDFKDGWGNKVGQYLSYSLPLLTSARGFAKQYISEHQCGIAYNEYDSAGLAEILTRLIEDAEYHRTLCENAKHRFNEDFEQSHVMSLFEKQINSVCSAYYAK